MKNKKTLIHLRKLYNHVVYYNKMAPFPVYCTDWVKDIKNEITKMEKEDKIDYDSEPVVACKYCKSLHIRTDEDMNDICFRCGSTNELTEFKNINEYNKFIHDNT